MRLRLHVSTSPGVEVFLTLKWVCSSGAFGANAPVVLKAPMVYDSGTMGYWCSLGALPCWLSKPGLEAPGL